MAFVKGQSFVRKLTWMNLLVSGLGLAIACVAFVAFDAFTFRDTAIGSLSIRSQVIGLNCVSALLFNDNDSANKTLSALKADPHSISAAIYTMDGTEFASYRRSPDVLIPPFPHIPPGQAKIQMTQDKEIDLAHVIESDGKPVGIIAIRADIQALYQRLQLYAGIGVLVLMASLLASLLVGLFLHRSVARPIEHLAEVARSVSQNHSYSSRVESIPDKGEITVLIDSFNEMMAQIEESEIVLEKARDELEIRVLERTAELVDAQKRVEAYSASVVQAMEEVERASKFKDQFLSTMSHELRTPLNAVLGFSELLSDSRYGTLNERQQRYINHIHSSGQHLLRLINDILDLSKIEAGRMQLTPEDVSVEGCFAEVTGAIQSLVDKKALQLRQSVTPTLAVHADPTRFNQILLNLLGNAIKFTPDGGSIKLAARAMGDLIRIEVHDSGQGIPPEEKQRVFEAFHRVKQSEKAAEGTGLGLAIARKLVELQGGELGLESEVGKGSCFYFTLPVAKHVAAAHSITAPQAGVAHGPVRVLVVDDDPAASDLLDSQLSSAGYTVTVCNQPLNAVQMAVELQTDVITLDIIMPPANGWELLANLKSDPRTASIPVIVCTVLDQRETAAMLAADEYVAKPVDRAILLAAVERSLSRPRTHETDDVVLVVEDDDAAREMIAEMLTGSGYRVETAANGELARSRVAASLPQLVILDIILPGVSGLELIAEWHKQPRTENLPILVLTSKDLTPKEKEYLHANTITFLSKHEKWTDKLLQQIRKAAPLALTENA